MNIHSYQKQISELLIQDNGLTSKGKPKKVYFPGVYIISRNLGYNLFKLGESHGGLYDRVIGQYKICMPLKSEFFLRYLVIAHRKKEGNLHYSQVLERALLAAIDSRVVDSYSKEYIFTPDIAELEYRMGTILNTHSKYTLMALKFTPAGFRLWDPTQGFNGPAMSFQELPNLNPAVSALLTLRKPPIKKPKKRIVYYLPKKRAAF